MQRHLHLTTVKFIGMGHKGLFVVEIGEITCLLRTQKVDLQTRFFLLLE